MVHYGEFGLVIFDPSDDYVLAVVSTKSTLRERNSQTGYWKLKLLSAPVTKDIKVFFITLDEDGTLTFMNPERQSNC